jgi:hypothetical protein
MNEERRSNRRVVVDVPARILDDGAVTGARLRDICRDAAFLLADRSWPLGTVLAVEVELPRVEGVVRFKGPVVRLSEAEGECGVAVLFDTVDRQGLLGIDLLLGQPISG